jgi:hypothetical protein
MFRSYDHLQVDIFLELTLMATDPLFLFRILVIIVNDYSHRSIVSKLLFIWFLFYQLK